MEAVILAGDEFEEAFLFGFWEMRKLGEIG